MTFSTIEIAARKVIEQACEQEDSSARVIIMRHVFQAQYYASLSVKRITIIGSALTCFINDEAFHQLLSAELTKLTRSKFLRSRVIKGERHYELNI